MSKTNNGGPAFPVVYHFKHNDGSESSQKWEGMTLRDHFAAQALPAVMMQCDKYFRLSEDHDAPTLKEYAQDAYRIADAMLAVREVS